MALTKIPKELLVADAIDATKIADDAIDSEHYTDGSIDTAHIAADAITAAKIADDVINSEHYAAASIDNEHLADNAVNSAELAAGSVDLAHMSVNSIDSDQYVDASIDTAHIAASNITNALMADNAIDSAEIASGAIDLAHMSVNSIDSDQYVDGSIDAAHLAADIITGAKIADDAIDSEHYTDGSIDNAHIADDAIDSEHYAAASIDTAHIADDQVTLAKMAGITRGSVIIGNSSGNPAALAIGSNTYVLKSDGTDIAWAADAGLSTEEVQDIAGGMFSSNTETGITATYQDGDGTIDLVVGTLNQDTTGTAATVTTAAQTNITSLGTLTGLTVSGDLAFTGASYDALWDKSANVLKFNDNTKALFGTGSDLEIYHDGSNSYVKDDGTGALLLMGSDVRLQGNGGTNLVVGILGGAVTLYHNNAAKLATVAGGVNITGDTDTDTLTVSGNATVGGTLGVTGATTLSGGVGVTGTATATAFTDGYVTWTLAQMNRYGGDIELQYTPTNTSTRVRIGGNGSNPTIFNAHSGNATIAGTLGVTGVATFATHVALGDSDILKFGASADLQIKHDGADSTIIDSGTGNLLIGSNSFYLRNAANNETMLRADENSYVKLYYDNAEKLATESGGVNVTGYMDADNFKVNGGQGSDGQVLTSTGSGVAWEAAGGGGASPSGSTNNTVTTVTGSDAIQGESNLTFLTNCLGVGIATESWASDVDAIQVGGLGALFSKSSQTADQHTNLTNNVYDDTSTGQSFIVSDCASKITLVDDHMAFHVSAPGTADNAIGFMEIARITNYSPGGGNMCVGTTASVGASNGKFFVNNGGGGGIISNVTGGSPLYLWRRDSGASTAQVYVTFWTSGGGDGGNIKTNDSGELTVNQASDYRIKENVVSIGSATEKVKQLNPIKFNIIGFPDLPRQGFLAHEVQEIVPQAVHGEKDAVDDDGEMIIQDMDATKLIPIMVKTIQELEARIATLEG